MRRVETIRKLDADCTGGDVNGPAGETVEDSQLAEDNAFDRLVVRQHREDDIRIANFGDVDGNLCSRGLEVSRLSRRAVEHGYCVTGLDQACGHASSHMSKANESDAHE